MENLTQVQDYSFDAEVLKCDVPVVADFYADWCGPCKQMEPALKEIAQAYTDEQIKVVKIDIDSNPITTAQYQVLSLPTVIVFYNGVPVKRMSGAKNKKQLMQEIDPLMPAEVQLL